MHRRIQRGHGGTGGLAAALEKNYNLLRKEMVIMVSLQYAMRTQSACTKQDKLRHVSPLSRSCFEWNIKQNHLYVLV